MFGLAHQLPTSDLVALRRDGCQALTWRQASLWHVILCVLPVVPFRDSPVTPLPHPQDFSLLLLLSFLSFLLTIP